MHLDFPSFHTHMTILLHRIVHVTYRCRPMIDDTALTQIDSPIPQSVLEAALTQLPEAQNHLHLHQRQPEVYE